MKIKLVRIVSHEDGWKGTWYKAGQTHFVTQYDGWPKVYTARWSAIDLCGGINEKDCVVLTGPVAWMRCAVRTIGRALTRQPKWRAA